MAQYPYRLVPPVSKNVYRPILKVQLGHPETKKFTPEIKALVDSGADICMASMDIALWLGIEFDGSENSFSIETANSSISQAIKKTITLSTPETHYRCPFFFVDIPPNKPILLGQQGFFDHFKVCFDFENKAFELI